MWNIIRKIKMVGCVSFVPRTHFLRSVFLCFRFTHGLRSLSPPVKRFTDHKITICEPIGVHKRKWHAQTVLFNARLGRQLPRLELFQVSWLPFKSPLPRIAGKPV